MEYKFNPKVQKLKQMQALSLESKIIMSRQRIKEWHEHYELSIDDASREVLSAETASTVI